MKATYIVEYTSMLTSIVPQAELEPNLGNAEIGRILPGVNTELRCLIGGVLAGGTSHSEQTIHESLQKLGYDMYHVILPGNNVKKQAERTIPNVFTVGEKSHDGTHPIELGDKGVLAVALAGVLLGHLPRESGVGLYRLVGGYRHNGSSVETGPNIRRMILNQVVGSRAVRKATIIHTLQDIVPDLPQGTIETQIKSLIDSGVITNNSGSLSTQGPNRKLIEAYRELTTVFQVDRELRTTGYNYMVSVSGGEHADAKLVPYWTKRSIMQSGKATAPKLNEFLQELCAVVDGSEVVTTSEIVSRTGYPADHVYDFLQRMDRIMGKSGPLVRLNGVKEGARSVRERRWKKPEKPNGTNGH